MDAYHSNQHDAKHILLCAEGGRERDQLDAKHILLSAEGEREGELILNPNWLVEMMHMLVQSQ